MTVDQDKLKKVVEDFQESGGSEMANAQLFLERLTSALGVPQPSPAKEDTRNNDYVFERNVTFRHTGGTTTTGRIDCYKRDCFIWEAKQSAKRSKARATEQLELVGVEAPQKLGQAKRGTKTWDNVIIAAKKQAEDYARALPDDHDYPPFIMVADIGNVIEVYADFSGQGRNYAHFPDRQTYRLSMEDLLDTDVQDRLRAIWTDPHSLDPARISAKVTEDIAQRLAKIAARLESRHDPKDIAEFLMRCLFTMFAEDVGLIEETEEEQREHRGPFEKMLERLVDTPHLFVPAMEALWRTMDQGGYAGEFGRSLKRFNGGLFRTCRALPLDADDIRELWLAARKDWDQVEPAIFGTLLERALRENERSMLGAHFTPRVYVERLVIPTIIEPLRSDWEEVLSLVEDLRRSGKKDAAVAAVRSFHHQLCTTRVLDPACGTGNFLYVSLELMKRLEGEVLETLEALGDDEARLLLDGETVSPRQFYGLDKNERAVPIADLVLWIGFLKWQLRTVDAKNLPEPILHAYGTVRHQDAILAFDKQKLLRDKDGKPLSRWDGETMKLHPITGEEIPDPDARVEQYTYTNPRRANWPEAEFIVGNPPFIGGKDMRAELGDGYAEAAWKARKEVPGGADFVMHFWDEAATRLLATPPKGKKGENSLRRFGFITTNSITQTFSRRVVERHMAAKQPLSLVYAIPDHPWLKASDKAAVRIAMTVAARGEQMGKLAKVVHESGLNTDTPEVKLEVSEGLITPGLRIGAQISKAAPLTGNLRIAYKGFMPWGAGFIVRPGSEVVAMTDRRGGRRHLLKYLNGRDLAHRPRGVIALDFFGLTAEQLQSDYPEAYQHLRETVFPERQQNNRQAYRERWWLFAESREGMRSALNELDYYFATPETAKHRYFVRLSKAEAPDQKVRVVASDELAKAALLSSRVHVVFANAMGARQGVGGDPVYNNSVTFDPFPFPVLTDAQSAELDRLGERLDAFRKERLAAHSFLTMTDLYNVLERLRELEGKADVPPLSQKERDIHEAGLISVLKDIHDDIDRVVFGAYGWSDLGERLVGKPGATTPSPHKSEDQEAAEEELLVRLVALNQERAAEEKRGLVRWLRPDYQKPRLDHKVKGQEALDIAVADVSPDDERAWPSDEREQFAAMRDLLADAGAPLRAEAVAAMFKGRNTPKRKERVARVLDIMADMGGARRSEEGYFLA